MKKRRRDHLVEEAAFDLTPMIDVVMLLIVFFMLTAQFAASMRAPLDLPRLRGETASESEHSLIIELTREGTYKLDSQPVELATIIRTVQSDLATLPSLDVIVRADRLADAAGVNSLASELTKVGVRSWSLATTGESGGRP